MASRARAIAAHPVTEMLVVGVLLALGVLTGRLLANTGVRVPYLALLPIVVLCCDFYGFRAALWATVVGAIAAWYFFLEPLMSFVAPNIGDAIQLTSFVAVALFVCWVLDTYRTTIRRLEESLEQSGAQAAARDASAEKTGGEAPPTRE